MARDDSILYSGITSVTSELKTPREAQKKAQEEAYYKLKPGYEVVLEDIRKAKVAVTDIRTLVIDRTSTEQEVNTELIARKLYLSYLNGLEAKIKNIIAKGTKK
jgi:preprotein translocase subunit YajC